MIINPKMALSPFNLLLQAILILPLAWAYPEATGHHHDRADGASYRPGPIARHDVDWLEFPINLEYLEAEFFLWASTGAGLDHIAPGLASAGPPPIGGQKANLDELVQEVILQFALQEVGHLRALKKTVRGFPRPLLNLTAANFGSIINAALNLNLNPPFDPYANSVNFLLASYLIPYVGLTGYVGANAHLRSPTAKRLVAGLLGVESGQDAIIRSLLYQKLSQKVAPYDFTVEELTGRISTLRNTLGHTTTADEGLFVQYPYGAEAKVQGNILAGDQYSVAYARSPEQILRIVYSSGNESIPGGFYPEGAHGGFASHYLSH